MPKPNRWVGGPILRQRLLHWLLTRIGIGNRSPLPRCAAPGEDRENTPESHMPTPSPGWRETLIVALQRTLHCEYSAGQVPDALREMPGHRLPALEDAISRQYWHADLPGFAWPVGAQPDEAAIDAQLFCAGCHRDGRVRERALRLMRDRPGSLTVALTLIRCDDWVPQVRVCAEEALQQIVAADPAALFAHLGLLFVLRERQRIRSGVWRTLIEPALLSPAHSAARWEALDHGGSRQRMFVCDLILRAEPAQIDALALKLGATVPAFITRATLANALAVAANRLTRQRLINATHQLSRWDALDCLLDGVDQDPYANDALHALIAWGNEAGRRFAPLSADRKRDLLQRIDGMTPRNMHIAWLPVRQVVEAG